MIATAGHVDHGKSLLVRALTGMEPDRWAEERRRGMTIDLGFAWTALSDDRTVAFVDVPGHQRFVSNMLAGVGPVPAVMLVVAADEGWRRQTGEHLAALHALDVRHGVLVITRTDLADPEPAIRQAHEQLVSTSLAGMETVAVSAATGAGIKQLREALGRLVAALPEPAANAPTRLWVDRVFTVRGTGTVVTGTLGSGRIARGDELVLMPAGTPVQVRGLQSLKAEVAAATATARVALSLRGVAVEEIRRGEALTGPGQWTAVSTVDVRLVRPADRLAARQVMHLGSANVPCQVRRLGADTARITLATPLPIHIGEHALLRDPGLQRIVSGVVILDPDPPALNRRGSSVARAQQLAELSGDADPAAEIRRRGSARRSRLVALGILAADGDPPASAVVSGDWLVDAAEWRAWADGLAVAVDSWAANHPADQGLPREAAMRQTGVPDAALVTELVRADPTLILDGRGIHRRGRSLLNGAVEQAVRVLERRLAESEFAAPEAAELLELGLTDRGLALAVGEGRLIRVTDGIFLRPGAVEEALRRVRLLAQPFTLSEGRIALGTTRRVAVPLFELMDDRGLTRRADDGRREICRPVEGPGG
ncbi:selenocysteine-specific translation elongation factor [Catenulispora acidiphila DSM 44928]|uniref:Selenocysteine-specific elongation factor n=1 Tax=Catenulispora acidiphila (strain DSM 44928 / JCM 14897 / NBRC 102108 / NRRL B-24433 / ID139908) TaxID=479433 RepID=C7QC98_CATAD|nr:selenocysteine-specific translation elongation factor [Catenulispora acidiphila DSM 44928]